MKINLFFPLLKKTYKYERDFDILMEKEKKKKK
jgi:hypothetical protein